jgi:hypothetical protein
LSEFMKIKFLLPIVFIILIATGLVGVVFLSSRGQNPIEDDHRSDSWSTIVSSDGQFSLKYPPELNLGFTSGQDKNFSGPDFTLSIGQIENRRGVTDDRPYDSVDAYIEAMYQDNEISDMKQITLDGKKVPMFKVQNSYNVLFFSADDTKVNYIKLFLNTQKPENSLSSLQRFNQLLSTVKFLK